MRCKIADPSQKAEPVAWRSVGQSAARQSAPQSPTNTRVPSGAQGGSEDTARTVELERSRQSEIAQARQAGLQTGLQDGLRQGREEAAAAIQQMHDQTAKAIDSLAQVKRKVRKEAEREVVNLAIAIARRILYRELTIDPESIEGIVHAAMQKLQQREINRVRVYPAGVAAVKAALERIGSRNPIEVVADGSLQLGGILFETAQGELDGSIETQLLEIQRGFADRLAIR
jgi:flagellar assembly protein FliH